MPVCSRVRKSRCLIGNINQPDSEFVKKNGTRAKVCKTCRQVGAIAIKKTRGYPVSSREEYLLRQHSTPSYMVHQVGVEICLNCPLPDGCIYDKDVDYQYKECPILQRKNGK